MIGQGVRHQGRLPTPFPTSFLLSYTAEIGLILRDDTDRSTPHRFRPPPRVRKSRGDVLPCGKAALLGRKAARRIRGGGPADFLPLDSGPSGPRFPNPRRNRAHTQRSGREFAAHAAAISLAALGASSSRAISARSCGDSHCVARGSFRPARHFSWRSTSAIRPFPSRARPL